MGAYAVVKDGVVINMVVWEPENKDDFTAETKAIFGDGVTAFESTDENPIRIGDLYDGTSFTAPPPTAEELSEQQAAAIASNKSTKMALMDEASQKISVLQDAVDLEMATDAETAALPLWKKYRVLLNRVDADTAATITWPDKPSS